MIVAADNECDGTVPSDGDLIAGTPTIAGGAFEGYLNPSYFGRFKILEDRTWNIGNISSPNVSHPLVHERFIELHDHKIRWDQNNGNAIANAREGHIFVWFFFKATTVAAGGIITQSTANPPGIQMISRLRYENPQ